MKCVHLPYVQQPWLCHQTDDDDDEQDENTHTLERCMLMTQILIFWIELIRIHKKKH